jgi:hypothetical protein
MQTLAHARVIARTDVSRTLRKYATRRLQLLVLGLVFVALVVGGGYVASRVGAAVADGGGDFAGFSLVAGARGLVAVFWLVGAVVFAVRAIGARGSVPGGEATLTVVPTRDAVAGLLLADLVYLLLYLGPAGIAVGAGLAIGAGSPLLVLTVPLALFVGGVGAVVVGFPVGLALRHVLTRIPFVARHKAWIVFGVFVLYFGALSTGTVDAAMVALFEPMRHSPPGWIADLLLLGLFAASPSLALAAGGVVLVAALVPVSVATTTLVARRHWFSDPALAGAKERSPATADPRSRRLEAMLAQALGRPTAAVVVLAWRRAARAPLKLLYVAYPLLFLAGAIADIVQTGLIPAYLPYGVLLFVTWAAAVVFTLNPLGDQGAALPVALLSRLSGRRFVHGQVLAGLLVAVPVGTVLTAAVGLASPLALDRVVLVTALAPVVMVLASVLAVGVGTAFPRFESIKITRSMRALVPSLVGFAVFTTYLFLTAAAAVLTFDAGLRPLVATLVSWLLPGDLGLSAGMLGAVSTALLVGLALLPLASYRYAVRQFDRYTLG